MSHHSDLNSHSDFHVHIEIVGIATYNVDTVILSRLHSSYDEVFRARVNCMHNNSIQYNRDISWCRATYIVSSPGSLIFFNARAFREPGDEVIPTHGT